MKPRRLRGLTGSMVGETAGVGENCFRNMGKVSDEEGLEKANSILRERERCETTPQYQERL